MSQDLKPFVSQGWVIMANSQADADKAIIAMLERDAKAHKAKQAKR